MGDADRAGQGSSSFRAFLRDLPDEIALARERGLPVELVVDAPLKPHAQRLMDTLGVPVEVREVTTVAHETIACPVKACSWTWVGVPSKAQPFVDAHLKLMHASANGASRQTEGRDLLDQMDRGERITPPAAPEPRAKRQVRPSGYWTRERILAAIRQWAAEHDGKPPLSTEWFKPSGGRWPAVSRVRKIFGTWSAGIEAAGFTPIKQGGRPVSRPAAAPPAVVREPEPEEVWFLVEPEVREAPAALSVDLIAAGDTQEWIAKLDAEAERLRRRSEAFDTIADGLRQLQETER